MCMAWGRRVHSGGERCQGDDLKAGLEVRLDRCDGCRLCHGFRGRFEGQIGRAKRLANLPDSRNTLAAAWLVGDALAESASGKAGKAKRGKLHINESGDDLSLETSGLVAVDNLTNNQNKRPKRSDKNCTVLESVGIGVGDAILI